MPSDNTLYVSPQGETLSEKSVSSKRDAWWARVPQSVLTDKRLQHVDIRVFAVIALRAPKAKHQAPKPIDIGVRLIAESIAVSKATVARAIERLIAAGHLIRNSRARGQRATYQFTSRAFMLVENRGGGEVVMTGYSGVPKHVGVVPEPVRPLRVPKARIA